MRQLLIYFCCIISLLIGELGSLYAQPIVDLGADTVLCGGSLVLNAGNAGGTYVWSTTASTQTISVTSTGTYWVDVTDGTGTTRDSIQVWVVSSPAAPIVNDTLICGGGAATILSQPNGGQLYWYDSTGTSLLGIGDSLNVDIANTTKYQIISRSVVSGFSAGVLPVGGFFAIGNDRGVIFDAHSSLILESIEIPITGNLAATIELYDDQNVLMFAQPVSLSAGTNIVYLGFEIPQGTGYRMMLAGLSGGGSVSVRTSQSFPISYPAVDVTSGFPTAGHFNYFYNWQISLNGGCSSLPDSTVVSVGQVPTVDLNGDSIVCGVTTYELDAGPSGTDYLWNTGEVSQLVTVDSTGFYSVLVTSTNGCSGADEVFVGFYDQPGIPGVNDTVVCGGGEVSLIAQNNGGTVFWRDSTGQNVLGIGDTLSTIVNSPSRMLIQSISLDPGSPAGLSNFGGFFAITNDRGLIFDALKPIVIESVVIPVTGTVNATIELYEPAGGLVYSKPVNLVQGNNKVFLGFQLERGEGYRMMLAGLTGGGSTSVALSGPFPITPEVRINSGTPILAHYNYFYDWTVSVGGNCGSQIDTVFVEVGSVPVVTLEEDTVVCGATAYILDAGNPGMQFLWSTGDTTQSITVDSLSNYSVQVAAPNGCVGEDEQFVAFVEEPVDPIVSDTSLCGIGSLELSATNNGGTLFWFDSTGVVIGIGNSVQVDVAGTTAFSIQSAGLLPGFTGGSVASGNYFAITNDRGLIFDTKAPIILEYVSVFTIGNINGELELYDEANTLLASKPVSMTEGLNELLVGFVIPKGENYRLMLANLSGGGSLRVNINATFPYTTSTVEVSSGFPTSSHYNYFFNWDISIGGNCLTPLQPVQVAVSLPVNLPDSIYSCSDTLVDVEVPNASYLWNTGATTSGLSVSETGLYDVEVSDGLGCVVLDTVFVEIPQDAGLEDDGILCGNVLTTNYGNEATFVWNTAATTPTITISSLGTYSVIVDEPRGCTLTDTIEVTGFDSFPVVSLGPDFSACDSTTIDLGNPGLTYAWSTGDSTQSLSVNASGQYIGTVINANQCATSDTIGVFIGVSPSSDFSFSFISDFQLSFNNLTVPFSTYFWNFGDGSTSLNISPLHTYADTGMYLVTLIATNGCGSDTIIQEVHVRDTSVGIGDFLAGPSLHVFPNPADNWVQVAWEGPSGVWRLSVKDLMGRILKIRNIISIQENHQEKLSVEELPAGVYYLQLENETSKSVQPFVIR